MNMNMDIPQTTLIRIYFYTRAYAYVYSSAHEHVLYIDARTCLIYIYIYSTSILLIYILYQLLRPHNPNENHKTQSRGQNDTMSLAELCTALHCIINECYYINNIHIHGMGQDLALRHFIIVTCIIDDLYCIVLQLNNDIILSLVQERQQAQQSHSPSMPIAQRTAPQ